MSFAAIATLVVAIAFAGLLCWVFLPRNRSRYERHGNIPLQADDETRGG